MQPSKNTKTQIKGTKIKNALKKTSKGEKVTYSLMCVFVLFVCAKERKWKMENTDIYRLSEPRCVCRLSEPTSEIFL